jgi:hypothetical protein
MPIWTRIGPAWRVTASITTSTAATNTTLQCGANIRLRVRGRRSCVRAVNSAVGLVSTSSLSASEAT